MKFVHETVAICALVCGFIATSFAIPYASQIKAEGTTLSAGSGTRISYVLNEAADTVTISLTDNETTVATFTAPAAQGQNIVSWNGTTDNAAGSIVESEVLRITVTATKAQAAWTEVAANRSQTKLPPNGTIYEQLFAGFTPNDCLFVADRASEYFGLGFADVSNTSPSVAAAIAIGSDLGTLNGLDGFASRVFRAPPLENSPAISALWGMSDDPDNSETFYFTGQANARGNRFWRGELTSSATLVSADPSNYLNSIAPRAVKVVREGTKKYAYFCGATDIYKAPMNSANALSGSPVLITSFITPNRYARGLDTDAAGNLYFVSKSSSGDNGMLLRWDAQDVQGANPVLNENSAAWKVGVPATNMYMMGPAITPDGDVYVAVISNGRGGAQAGIYFAGNAGSNMLLKTLLAGDCVVDFANIGEPASSWETHPSYFNLRSDPVGNLLAIDRSTEQLRLFSPPRSSTISITAPPSQTIRAGTGVKDWALY